MRIGAARPERRIPFGQPNTAPLTMRAAEGPQPTVGQTAEPRWSFIQVSEQIGLFKTLPAAPLADATSDLATATSPPHSSATEPTPTPQQQQSTAKPTPIKRPTNGSVE